MNDTPAAQPQPTPSQPVANIAVEGERYLSNPWQSFIEALTRLQRTNLVNVLLLSILGSLIGVGFAAALIGSALINLFSSTDSSPYAVDVASASMFNGMIFAVIIAMMVLSVVMTVATKYMFVRAQNNDKISVGAALKRGLKRFFPALGAFILTGLVVLIGLIALIAPGIYLLIRLIHVHSIVANENVGPIQAMKRSFALTRGRFFDVVGAITIGIVIGALSQIILDQTMRSLYELPLTIMMTLLVVIIAAYIVINLVANITLSFRYHQSDLDDTGAIAKTGTSPVNYLMILVAIVVVGVYGFISYSNEMSSTSSPNWSNERIIDES